MFKALFQAFKGNQAPHALYGAVVAQSRSSEFYQDMGVPDTMNGRFEMMCLHIYLILRRMKREGSAEVQYNQDLFDVFLDDMEAGLREAGVGDTTVPKRIKKMSRIFYGQAKVLEEIPLEDHDLTTHEKVEKVCVVLERNLYPEGGAPASIRDLGSYFVAAFDKLCSLEASQIKQANDVFPHPAKSEI